MTGSVGNHVLDFDLDTLVIDTTAICLCISELTAPPAAPHTGAECIGGE